jgi:hypothetical protein
MGNIIKQFNAKNVFIYGAINEKHFEAIAANVGKKRETTFFSDLSIAEWYGQKSVKDTYNNVMKSWIGDVKYIAEFCLCLAWKSYQHNEAGNDEMCKLYWGLFTKCQDAIYKHYEGNSEATSYIFHTLD